MLGEFSGFLLLLEFAIQRMYDLWLFSRFMLLQRQFV